MVPSKWMSVGPGPVGKCGTCGAEEAKPHGPKVPMKPQPIQKKGGWN